MVELARRVRTAHPESGFRRAHAPKKSASVLAAGFSAKSTFLTSPTFGGISWLAHSTLQSGMWIDIGAVSQLTFEFLSPRSAD
jgi:hypothetical protein